MTPALQPAVGSDSYRHTFSLLPSGKVLHIFNLFWRSEMQAFMTSSTHEEGRAGRGHSAAGGDKPYNAIYSWGARHCQGRRWQGGSGEESRTLCTDPNMWKYEIPRCGIMNENIKAGKGMEPGSPTRPPSAGLNPHHHGGKAARVGEFATWWKYIQAKISKGLFPNPHSPLFYG